MDQESSQWGDLPPTKGSVGGDSPHQVDKKSSQWVEIPATEESVGGDSRHQGRYTVHSQTIYDDPYYQSSTPTRGSVMDTSARRDPCHPILERREGNGCR